MKRWFSLLIISIVLLGGSTHPGQTESNDSKDSKSKKSNAKLVLDVSPRQGLSPHHATISARLEGVEDNDQEWYCLKQEWDFGDGAISSEEPQCDPFTPETKILKEFYVDHNYEDPGYYKIRFKLGDDKLRSNAITVVVLEGQNQYRISAKLSQ